MAYVVSDEECIKCGICVKKCPQGAISEIITIMDNLEIHDVKINTDKCNDCGICAEVGNGGYFCPAEAIHKI